MLDGIKQDSEWVKKKEEKKKKIKN